MQFRLLASSFTATNLNPIFFPSPPNITTTLRSLSPTVMNFATSPTGRAADPALYSDSQQHEAAASSTTEKETEHNSSTTPNVSPIEGVSCAGLDGSPWPEEENDKSNGAWSRERKEQEEDDMEYYSHHKASPLSEIEVADSRKPLAKVMYGTADGYKVGGSDELILFREEQLDTAEDALRRATEMWRESAVRGDPDSPHGRILRALRGEYW